MPQYPSAAPAPAAEYEVVFAQLRSTQVTDLLQRSSELSQRTEAIQRLGQAVQEAITPRFVTYTTG